MILHPMLSSNGLSFDLGMLYIHKSTHKAPLTLDFKQLHDHITVILGEKVLLTPKTAATQDIPAAPNNKGLHLPTYDSPKVEEVNDAAQRWIQEGCATRCQPHVIVPVNLQHGLSHNSNQQLIEKNQRSKLSVHRWHTRDIYVLQTLCCNLQGPLLLRVKAPLKCAKSLIFQSAIQQCCHRGHMVMQTLKLTIDMNNCSCSWYTA